MTGAHKFSDGYARRRVTLSGRYVVDAVPGLSTYAALSLAQGQRSVSQFRDNAGMSATMEGQSDLNPSMVQAGVGYRDLQATFLYQHLGTNSIAPLGLVLPTGPQGTFFDSYYGELIGTFRPSDRVEIVPRFNVTYQRPWQAPDLQRSFYFLTSVRRLRGRLLGRWAPIDDLLVRIPAGRGRYFRRRPSCSRPRGSASRRNTETRTKFPIKPTGPISSSSPRTRSSTCRQVSAMIT